MVGSRVEALWDEQTEYYQGVVESLNEDGTYNILYDDGDREQNVKPQHARLSHLTFRTRVKVSGVTFSAAITQKVALSLTRFASLHLCISL